jgi:hypothetical protein
MRWVLHTLLLRPDDALEFEIKYSNLEEILNRYEETQAREEEENVYVTTTRHHTAYGTQHTARHASRVRVAPIGCLCDVFGVDVCQYAPESSENATSHGHAALRVGHHLQGELVPKVVGLLFIGCSKRIAGMNGAIFKRQIELASQLQVCL